jgi:2-keto-4-pentenoate hydratase/2-oxohepta-3-ene-1,7-dioic acid hydratase in catechol pathway
LPRAFQRIVCAAKPRAAQAERPALRQFASDAALGPHALLRAGPGEAGLGTEAALAAITGDVARAAGVSTALDSVRLLALSSDWAGLDDTGATVDPLLGPAGCNFAPLTVTPDELGAAWSSGRVHGELHLTRSGGPSTVAAAQAMGWHFGEVISAIAGVRPLRAGSIVGIGLHHTHDTRLQSGGRLRLELHAAPLGSIFGAIELQVDAPGLARRLQRNRRRRAAAGRAQSPHERAAAHRGRHRCVASAACTARRWVGSTAMGEPVETDPIRSTMDSPRLACTAPCRCSKLSHGRR